jgi:peptidoglycan/xylan/chitin deacetylase (PgdA/CDA1 family)
MPARFILSFDCEGKWGSADALGPMNRRCLTDPKLQSAYAAILGLLHEYDVEATFAFAGLFSQSRDQFARLRSEVELLARQEPSYLAPALGDMDATRGDGWHGDHLVEAVAIARVRHEIALHGVTHVPWTGMDHGTAAAELRLFEALEGPVRQSRTFVYPRNLVAHTELLARSGFIGFRAARRERSRLSSLLSELNLFEKPEQPSFHPPIIAIPAGFFLNWRHGVRRLVPSAVTIARARRLLKRAAPAGAVVHYWLHPENIATAPATLDLLRSLLIEVARARDAGDCDVMTQLGYCRSIESRG